MFYQFAPAVQAGIEAGKYIPVLSNAGVPLSMVRYATGSQAGQFAAHAVGVASQGAGMALGMNPLTAVPQLAMGAGQMYQNQMTLGPIKSLSASVATLQATTAVIGVGVVATGALVAVNLWQTIKLRQDVKKMRLEVQEGFLNLHEALADQGEELLKHIDQVAEDVEFRNHRTILVRAYGQFNKALNRLRTASTLQDYQRRSDEITAARDMLFIALSDYDNNQLMEGVCSAGFLRRRECVWAIEQAIAMTYQMQGEFSAVSDRLSALDQTIRQDSISVINRIEDTDELDFFFPEIHRIHGHDLPTISAWHEHANWYQTLSADELKAINTLPAKLDAAEELETGPNKEEEGSQEDVSEMPWEYQLYEKAQNISHPNAMRDSLYFLMDDESRIEFEEYVSERAKLEGLSSLTEKNLKAADSLTVANLLYYFQCRDKSLQVEEEEVEAVEVTVV
jgi:DNA-binding ferritin-like protein